MGDESAKTIERTMLAGGLGDAAGTPIGLKADETTRSLRVNLWVWDAGTLAWVKMTQPALEADVDNLEALEKGNYWKETRYDYDGADQVIYEGRNTTHKAATSDTDWEIWKQTWSAAPGNLTRRQGPLTGSWDGRAALSW